MRENGAYSPISLKLTDIFNSSVVVVPSAIMMAACRGARDSSDLVANVRGVMVVVLATEALSLEEVWGAESSSDNNVVDRSLTASNQGPP